MSQDPFHVTKASGDLEMFEESKVFDSLKRSGLSDDIAYQALDYLKKHIKDDISTDQVFSNVNSFLRDNAPKINYYNYGLKRAIMTLGPSGHPFENLIGELLEHYGFRVNVTSILRGKCITHEIDVIAEKDNELFLIECKYHNSPGIRTDAQVALYTWARLQDLIPIIKQDTKYQNHKINAWLMTNTKASQDAINFCNCSGMRNTAWSIPRGESLQELILQANLHPISILESIPEDKKQQLLTRGITTCKTLGRRIDENKVQDILTQNEIELIRLDIKLIDDYGKSV